MYNIYEGKAAPFAELTLIYHHILNVCKVSVQRVLPCLHIHTYIHTYILTYIQHTYTYIHTYIHTYIRVHNIHTHTDLKCISVKIAKPHVPKKTTEYKHTIHHTYKIK